MANENWLDSYIKIVLIIRTKMQISMFKFYISSSRINLTQKLQKYASIFLKKKKEKQLNWKNNFSFKAKRVFPFNIIIINILEFLMHHLLLIAHYINP